MRLPLRRSPGRFGVDTPAATREAIEASASPAMARKIEDDRERLTGASRIILIVEDDETFARILCDLERELGFQCLIAATADEGVTVARQYLPMPSFLMSNFRTIPGFSCWGGSREMCARGIFLCT